ncbi:hypothetical protein [uncultured Bacteroides sp.]|uniref:hypothetical protein n=2 Tax=uncultured Bacteroides sp. TaxID=162156 RepID=UPI0025E2DED1|nr:hypothetical protein [uncultured Bacteroides sp.]
MAKKLNEDQIKWILSLDASEAEQGVNELTKKNAELTARNKELRKSMQQLEMQGKKNTAIYQSLSDECSKNTKQISDNRNMIKRLDEQMGLSNLSMTQLKRRAQDLRKQLDETSQALHPHEWEQLNKQLTDTQIRMNELKESGKSVESQFQQAAKSTGKWTAFFGNLYMRIADWGVQALGNMKEVAAESVEMAEAADGVDRAFRAMDDGSILDNLRRATKGTVTDLDLMKAAIQAKDFRIPLEDLGKYLQFAQLKAQQTGQSVDYMTNSIVTGLGRKSVMILDNLGISAAEINEQMSRTGDFMSAVASIVDRQLAAAGDNYVSSADRAQAASVRFKNAQLELGKTLLPLKEKWDDLYTGVSVGTMELIGWAVKHRDVLAALVATYTAYRTAKELATTATYKEMTATKASILLDKMKLAGINNVKGVTLLYAAAKAKLAGNVKRAAAAMRLFNMVCKASTIGWIAGAVAAAGTALVLLRKRTDEETLSMKSLNSIRQKAADEMDKQAEKINTLSALVHNSNLSYRERKNALEELIGLVPGYNASLTTEGELINDNTDAINEYLAALEKQIKMKAAREELEELYRKQRATKKRLGTEMEKEEQAKHNLTAARFVASMNASKVSTPGTRALVSGLDQGVKTMQTEANKAAETVRQTKQELADIDKAIRDVNMEIAASVTVQQDAGNAATDLIEAKKKEIEEAEKIIATTPAEVEARNKKVAKLKEELEALQNLGVEKKKTGKNPEKNERLEADKKAIADTAALRDQALADEERRSTAALNAHKLMLQNKQLTEQQYAVWEAAYLSNLADRRLSIEEEHAGNVEALGIENAALKEQAVKDAGKRVEQAEQQAFDARLKAEQVFRDNVDALREMAQSTPATPEAKLKAEYDTRLQLLEAYYQASLDYARKNGQDEAGITELYNRAKLNLDKQYQDERKKLAEKSSEELEALQGNDISRQFTDIFNNIDKLKEAIDNADFGGMLQSIQGIVNSVLSGLSNAFNTFKQIEIDNVEAKYDAEIEAAQGNAEEVERLEQEKAQKKLDIEKKYADVQFAVKASQIIANTALAIMMAFAQLGPIAGPIAAGLMAATGAIQLAAANAERNKVKNMTLSGSGSGNGGTGARVATGRQSGGKIDVRRAQDGKLFPDADYAPDARGFIDRPTVIVGEGPSGQSKEWVASNAAVSNPTVAPILDILDKSQQAGTIRTLDLNQAIRTRMAGYAAGGSIHNPIPVSPHSAGNAGTALPPDLMRRFANAIVRLDEEGLPPAPVLLSELERKQELRNRSRAIGSKK